MGGLWGSFPASIPLPRRASPKKQKSLQQHPTPRIESPASLKPSSSPCAPASTGVPRSRHCRHGRHKGPAKMGHGDCRTERPARGRRWGLWTERWTRGAGRRRGAPGLTPTRWQTLPRVATPLRAASLSLQRFTQLAELSAQAGSSTPPCPAHKQFKPRPLIESRPFPGPREGPALGCLLRILPGGSSSPQLG